MKENLNVKEIYSDTLFSLEEVMAGRRCMYEVYFFQIQPDGEIKKMRCQSLFCSTEPEESERVLAERRELLADTHGVKQADISMNEIPLERVGRMLDRLLTELQGKP